ncbi:cupin domain-containing protein [Novosphingobium sp.]|uniref:cupin domain-containing protein n=1 Tax=Novosphingobium sp. TaxID=1874826 RepID=UPI00286A2D44|nr:cupin domain-containing protein [Novosphingobium sp.]
MTMQRYQLIALGGAIAGAAIIAGSVATATAGSGFVPTSLALGHFGTLNVKADKTDKWDLYLKTKDSTDIGMDRLAVAPGGYSGWHTHAGPVFIIVKSGSVVRSVISDSGCAVTTYRAGQTFIEDANVVHTVANASNSDPAELLAMQMRPEGSPGRIDAPAPVVSCP